MKTSSLMTGMFVAFALMLFTAGCESSDTVSGGTNDSTTTGLFTTSGSMSFTSTRGDFSAQGIFDTLMSKPSAAGAFRFNITPTKNAIMLFAYNATVPTAVKVAFIIIADTTGMVGTGSYSFTEGSGAKIAGFAYIPNAVDTTAGGTSYQLSSGSVSVTSLSTTSIVATFSGSGVNQASTGQTITVSNGSANMPVTNYQFEFDGPRAQDRNVVGRALTNAMQEYRSRF